MTMVKGGEADDGIRILIESLFTNAEASNEARVEEDQDYEHIEAKLHFLPQSYLLEFFADVISSITFLSLL